MSTTLGQVLTSIAYRLGEDSAPSTATEIAKRTSFVNEGYLDICRKKPFWFLEESTTFNTVADQETYTTSDGFPADYRDMIELRVDSKLYTYIPEKKVYGQYDSTITMFNYDGVVNNRHWYIFDSTLHILPAPASVLTVSMKYYKNPTKVSSSSDTFLIPDLFLDAVVALACARISAWKGLRGDAADFYKEYDELFGDLVAEDNRQKFYGKAVRPVHPDYLLD